MCGVCDVYISRLLFVIVVVTFVDAQRIRYCSNADVNTCVNAYLSICNNNDYNTSPLLGKLFLLSKHIIPACVCVCVAHSRLTQ